MNFKDAVIIDVRTQGEFSMGNVNGSINIPLDTIPNRLDEIRNMGKPIVVCCASGGRSNAACQWLNAQGLTDVFDGGPWTIVDAQVRN